MQFITQIMSIIILIVDLIIPSTRRCKLHNLAMSRRRRWHIKSSSLNLEKKNIFKLLYFFVLCLCEIEVLKYLQGSVSILLYSYIIRKQRHLIVRSKTIVKYKIGICIMDVSVSSCESKHVIYIVNCASI